MVDYIVSEKIVEDIPMEKNYKRGVRSNLSYEPV